MLLLKVLPLFILAILNIVLGVSVIARDRKVNNFSFFLLTVAIGGWVLGIGAFLLTNNPDTAFILAKVYYFFPMLIALALNAFTSSFPSEKTVNWRLMSVLFIGFLVVTVPLIVSKSFLTQDLIYHDWGKEIVLNRTHYVIYSGYLLCGFGLGLYTMYKKSRTLIGLQRAQSRLFFVGFFITATFGVFFNLILPFVGNYRLIHLGPLFTNVLIASLAYSIIRHKMFNLRLIVARSLGYLLSLGILALGYGGVTYVATNTLERLTSAGRALQVFNILLLVIAVMSYSHIKQFFDKATSRIFFRDAYEPEQFLDQLNKIFVSNIELEYLLEASCSVISQNIKAEYCTFVINETAYTPVRLIGTVQKFDPDLAEKLNQLTPQLNSKVVIADYTDKDQTELNKLLEDNGIAVLVRLVTTLDYELKGIGYLALGVKKSGNLYSKQDTQVLDIIANGLVIAAENALRFEEIEKFNVTLQEKVDVATKRLQNSNEKLKTLDETKDEFISMASHQLRTPLTSVKGYLSMVLEGDAGALTEMQHKLLDQAFISSQRMVYLIADLLNVSRLRTGKFIIEAAPSNLAEVIEGEVGQLKATAASRKLSLSYNKPENFPTLMLDETKIRQVIMNFMDNAIYYTPAGGHITVELKETDQTVEYTVNDDGMGVPRSEQHHLFTKFYRAGNAKKARPDGTGLGLFMSKKVIVAQGGNLIFRSQENKGSTFGFSFEKTKLLPNPAISN